jgi:hypothetical protein
VRNSHIAELLAGAAECAKQPVQGALRRAARSFLWPEEAKDMLARGHSFTELAGIDPYLNKQIINWLTYPPGLEEAIPKIRQNFLTLAGASTLGSKYPERFQEIRGDHPSADLSSQC